MQPFSDPSSTTYSRNHSRFKQLGCWVFALTSMGASIQAFGAVHNPKEEPCRASIPDTPLHVTAACVDPEFSKPVIDSEENIANPVSLYKVSGHFEGTSVTFTFYYPPKAQWQGRFFHNAYPFTDGTASAQSLQFGSKSGAYIVKTGQSSGYRADAAAAKFSRQVARDYYGLGDEHIYGYVYGGSGGSYQTIAAVENSEGVWDGAVPYVMGTPTSIPNNFFVRAFARVSLLDKANLIADAMLPGGSGDPYASLDQTQASVLREVTAMGVPLQGWSDPEYLLGLGDAKGLMGFRSSVKQMDPGYEADFWHAAGYLGTEKSPLGDLFRAAVVDDRTAFVRDDRVARTLQLERVPERGYAPEWEYTLLDAEQQPLAVIPATLDVTRKTLKLDEGQQANVDDLINRAAAVRIDNRWALALAAYHRYQVPHEPGIKVWNQFLDVDGRPKFPQRPEVGPRIARGASGGGQFTGNYAGKMIVIGNLLDVDAFPWDADWYAARVKSQQGSAYSERFRLWFNENADHHDGSVIVSGKTATKQIRLVSYVGILEQSLRDLSAWVEDGIAPPQSTTYDMVNGQIEVAPSAYKRYGIQPVIEMTASGKARAEVGVSKPIRIKGRVQAPPGAGIVVHIEWNESGDGRFVSVPFSTARDGTVTVEKDLVFEKPGTYYPVLRVTTDRAGDPNDDIAQVQNLARIRVVVSE